jgi:hypothetical protein
VREDGEQIEGWRNPSRYRGMGPKGQKLVGYGHGGSLDPDTGRCVHQKKVFTPTTALINAMAEADVGKIKVNRENDPLTLALRNPKHPGHT